MDGLLTAIRKKNKVKVLGLTATPIINELYEGRSMIELITGKIHDDVATTRTLQNAVTMYQKLMSLSIREIPEYGINIKLHEIHVGAPTPLIDNLRNNPLDIEQYLTDARMPEIIANIDPNGKTIIYTEYVTDIIERLSDAVRQAGYQFALYTGSDRSGLELFIKYNDIRVLLASRPVSVGVDALQHVCNRVIINTIPWTNAQYQQLLGRLVRYGQKQKTVDLYIIKASIGGYTYDDRKWNMVLDKRTLAECAVDGILPEKNLVTPTQAVNEAIRWLERLERGEVSSVNRMDVDVELKPVEVHTRLITYGDLAKQNRLFNTERSDTTHTRLQQNPQEWIHYHRTLKEERKEWPIDPLVEIIKRLRTMPSKLKIGDFGCGLEARIANELGLKEGRDVISFDHLSVTGSKIIACDMRDVSQYVDDGTLDVAVYSLSLMGTNWRDYIVEAKRCLCVRGSILIAVSSKKLSEGVRLKDLPTVLSQNGFAIDLDEIRGDFRFIEATKLR